MKMTVEQLCNLKTRTREAQKSLMELNHRIGSSPELSKALYEQKGKGDDATLTEGTLSGMLPLFDAYADIISSIMCAAEIDIGGRQVT